MASPKIDAAREICYNSWLDAFDDGLDYAGSPPRSMPLVVSHFEGDDLMDRLENSWSVELETRDTWSLPFAHEKDVLGHPDHPCGLWVGWWIPDMTDLYRPDRLRNASVENCGTVPLNHTTVKKAFKVVYKLGVRGPKLFALCEPNPDGLCIAAFVPREAENVFFFEEWRDDTLLGRLSREKD